MAETLDELIETYNGYIEYHREGDSRFDRDSITQCEQIVDLLRELKLLRSAPMHMEAIREIERLAIENAKLRELAGDMRLQLSYAYDIKELVEYDERIDALGIEVNDEF